jgi:hypothetical protein
LNGNDIVDRARGTVPGILVGKTKFLPPSILSSCLGRTQSVTLRL